MTVDDVARIFPHIPDADRQSAADLYTAAEGLQTAFKAATLPDNVRRMCQQQVAQAVFTSVNAIGQA